jgi:hypothetical protein
VAGIAARNRVLAFGSAALAVLAGALFVALSDGLVGDVIGISLITVGLGAVVLLLFYEVGLSEDQERAREERRRARRRRAG